MKLVKEFFVYKINVVLLYSADMLKNRLKIEFKGFYYRMVSNTERVHKTNVFKGFICGQENLKAI